MERFSRSRRRRHGHAFDTRASAQPLERRVLMAAGDLDTTFGGGDGIVVNDFLGRADAAGGVAPLAGGRFVVAGTSGGDVALARYNANGSLDTTFAVGGADGNGVVITDFGGDESVRGVALQPDGKII